MTPLIVTYAPCQPSPTESIRTSVCEPGVRQREYVYVWESVRVPEVIATPSILTLISFAQVCVVSVTG